MAWFDWVEKIAKAQGTTYKVPIDSVPAGTAIMGKVGIDQTTDGTTNKVQSRNATHDDFNANANMQVGNADVGAANTVPVKFDQTTPGTTNGVSLTDVLDKDLDSIDVGKMSKGAPVTAHSAITATATSDEIDCRGFNAILIETTVTVAASNWTIKVQGCMVSGGTFLDWYELANTGTMTLMSYQFNASRGFVFRGIPDWVKIVATEDVDGATVTVKAQPLNL